MKIRFYCCLLLVLISSSCFCQAMVDAPASARVITYHPADYSAYFSGLINAADRNQSFSVDSGKVFKASDNCSLGYISNNDTTVCVGSVVRLNSTSALTYHWSPGEGLNDSSVQNPWLVMNSTRTFHLLTTDYSVNLVANPGFELGNTGFETDYTWCDSPNCLWPLGDYGYSVGADASYYLNTYFSGHDHTSGSGNFMIINGGRSSLTAWRQTNIQVIPGTQYVFGVWISSMNNIATALIRFSINGSQVGSNYNAPSRTNEWEQVFITWNSGSNTTATLAITDIKNVIEGNDFGLDDIFFSDLITCKDSVTIHVSQNVNLGQDTSIYPGDLFVISPSGGPFEQYNWNTGDTTPFISVDKPGRYWLEATDFYGCKSVDTIFIRDARSYIVFPNAFSPNADGTNDVFRPSANNVLKFHMSVFNQWGQFLFETENIKTGWSGMVGGVFYPAAFYVYTATYEFTDNPGVKTVRGSFSLIR